MLRRGLAIFPSAFAETARGIFLVTAVKYLQGQKESGAARRPACCRCLLVIADDLHVL